MLTRLETLPQMQGQIDRIERIFPDAITMYSEDGTRYTARAERDGVTFIVFVELDISVVPLVPTVRGLAYRGEIPVFDVSQAEEIFFNLD